MKWLNHISFKYKTILGIAIIESLLLALIYFTSLDALNKTNEQQVKQRAHEATQLIALGIRNGLLTYDIANTEQFIQGLVKEETSLLYVRVKQKNGQTFAFAGNIEQQALTNPIDESLAQAQSDGIYDTRSPITIDRTVIGEVEIGFSVASLSTSIEQASQRIQIIALSEIILSALFSWLLGWWLTRRVKVLHHSVSNIENIQTIQPIEDDARDEIGMVSRAFNHMAANLKQQHAEINQKSLKLASVFHSTPDGVVIINHQGLIDSVNPAFMEILQCGRNFSHFTRDYDELLQALESRLDFTHTESRLWFSQIQNLHDLHQLQGQNHSLVFNKPNYRSLRAHFQVLQDEESGIEAILYLRDQTQLEQVERLKSALLDHAAHEMRTPLTSIMGFSELLSMQNLDEAQRIELARIINQQSHQVVEIINNLLDISKIESEGAHSLFIEEVNINECVQQTLHEFFIPEGRLAPQVHFSDASIRLHTDASQLRQVLINLISNAYKYSSPGDQVSLSVSQQPATDKQNHCIKIQVQDQGIGMSAEQLEQIFDRFWRADQSGAIPGTGLGMSLVKEIIDLLHGHIEIESQIDQGSTFTITLSNHPQSDLLRRNSDAN